ncbi:MAG: DUF1003 domain-containing protein [Polyangiaceae bacterium]
MTPEEPAAQHPLVADLQARAERRSTRHHRAVDAARMFLGRPIVLYGIVVSCCLWALANRFAPTFGVVAPDPAPFYMLQGIVGLSGLLVAIVIVSAQNHQATLIAQREDFDLRLNLLAERKTAKIIELLEELRRDLPSVQNRRDTEAEILQQAADPKAVLIETPGQIASREARVSKESTES